MEKPIPIMIQLLHPTAAALLLCCLLSVTSLQASNHPYPCLDDWEEGAFPPNEMAFMTVSCPFPVNATLPSIGCEILIDIPEPTSNCMIISITNDFNGMESIPEQLFGASSFTITWTVVDCDGEFTCTQFVSIQDQTAPIFVCPSSTIEQCSVDDMLPFANIDELVSAGAVVMDNCQLDSTYLLAGDPVLIDAGPCPMIYERTYTVRDTSGNEATCMQTILVNDTTSPVFTCPINITVSTSIGECEANIVVPEVLVADNCGVATLTNNLAANPGDIVTFPVGDTAVKYYAEDACGNIDSCETMITVLDETPPIMTCADDDAAQCSATEVSIFMTYAEFTTANGSAADNCGMIDESSFGFVSESSDNLSCPETVTRIYSILDDSGNMATCEQIILISENEAPTFTVPLDTIVNCGANIDTMNVGIPTDISDNCGAAGIIISFSDSQTLGGLCPVIASITRSWTATDICGNISAIQDQVITIQDTIKPVAICQLDTLYLDSNGDVNFDVNAIDGGSFDACGSGALTLSSNFNFTTCNDAMLIQDIVLTVTDACGNFDTCLTSILVLDTIPASLTCPPTVIVACPSDVPSGYTTYLDFENDGGIFTDNCQSNLPADFYLSTEVQLGTTCPYDILRTYVASDNNGNIDSCVQTITVNDTDLPIVSCPANMIIIGSMSTCDTMLIIPLATATDACGITSITNDYTGGGADASGTFSGGETIVTFTATDNCGNIGTCVMTVIVDVNPALGCPSDITVDCELSEEPIFTSFAQFMNAGGSANLGCGADTSAFTHIGDILISTNSCTQIYERTYGLPGMMGEMFECTYEITVTDDENPVITCATDINVNASIDQCTAMVELTPIATDNCGSVTVTNDFTSETIGAFPIGTTMVTFTATDNCGNASSCTMNVTVNDAQAPYITCPEGALAMCDANMIPVYNFYQHFIDADATSDISDNCKIDTSSFIYEGEMELIMFGFTFVNRTYSIQDSVGNTSSCTQVILVMDSTEPFVTCPVDLTVDAEVGLCTAMISGLIASTGDNCLVDTIYNSRTGDGADASDVYPVGETVVTFTVEDEEGNSNTCSFTVTVEDNVLPIFTCPNSLTATECGVEDNFAYTSFMAFQNAGGSASDVCGIDTSTFMLVSDVLTSSTNCSTMHERTYKIEDNNGNETTCVQAYQITDTTPPAISCPTNVVLNTDPGVCNVVSTITVTATDFCSGGLLITNDFDTSTDGIVIGTFPLGPTTILFTATDDCGLSSTCSVLITVEDQELPQISFTDDPLALDTVRVMCNLSEAIALADFDELIAAGGQVSDNCMVDNPSFTFLSDVLVPGSDPISYIRSYEIADAAGNLNTLEQIIIIHDTEEPSVTAPADITVDCDDDISDTLITGTATTNDNCTPSTLSIEINDEASVLGCPNDSLILRIFTVMDDAGNTAIDTQRISKIDSEAPVFDVNANLNISIPTTVDDTIACDQDFLDPIVATATDACGTHTITVDTLPFLANVCSGYQVNYRYIASDACMNSDTLYSGFWVSKDTTAPIVTVLDTFVILSTDSGVCEATATLPIPTVLDCSEYVIVNSIDGKDTLTSTFPLGETTFSYTITDECGNITVVDQTVTVEDNESPNLVCRTTPIQVSISSDMSIVYAPSFILDATDNCGNVNIQVRRINDLCNIMDNEVLGDSLFFCCADVGSIHEVEVVVTDDSGNQNTCIALAEVSDKIKPSFLIPIPDVTVSCDYPLDLTDLDDFGTFVLTGEDRSDIIINDIAYDASDGLVGQDGVYNENCPIGTTVTTEVIDMTTNSQGTIMRIFTITDTSGNSATYTQRIFVIDFNPFSEDDITWPEDATIEGCEIDIPTLEQTGVPTFTNINKCHEIQYSNTDLVFDNPTSGCVYIRRTFKVIDSNIYDPNVDPDAGIWTMIQDIFMTNSVKPEFDEACIDTLICAQGTGCNALVELSVSATDDCTDTEDLEYSYTIDTDNDGSVDITGVGSSLSEILPQGMHEIVFTVSDRCGNTETCVSVVEVKECKPPSIACIALAIDLSPGDGTAQIWASDFNASSSDNCTDAEDLLFSFSSDPTEFGRSFDCDSIGIRVVEIWVTDEAGNQAFCVTTVDVQDNTNACGNGLNHNTVVMGLVTTQNNMPIPNTTIVIDGPEMDKGILTDDIGEYVFVGVPMYNDYVITPTKDDEHLKGVSTLDLVLIQRHILALDELDSPYDIIAADVNASENVSAADIIELRKMILGVQEEFDNNESFRFVESDYSFADNQDPFPFMEEMEFAEVDEALVQSDFVAIKIGDVNGSIEDGLTNTAQVETRSDNALVIYTEDQYLQTGETVIIPIYTADITSLAGLQFTADYDSEYLEFVSADGGQIVLENSQMADHKIESKTTIAWSSFETISDIRSNEPLAYFAYSVKRNGKLSDVWSITSDITEALAYDASYQKHEIELRFDEATTPGFAMFQNQPNPFTEYTEVIFELPKSEEVSLQVFDSAGKIVHKQSSKYNAGKHIIRLNTEQLTKSGVYFYKIKAGEYSEARKMLKIK